VAKKAPVNDPVHALAKELLAALARRREEGGEYPCTLRALGQSLRPELTDVELLAALGTPPLKTKAVLACDGDASALLALKDDRDRLLGDERLLRELLSRVCSPNLPVARPATLAGLVTKTLQAPFKRLWTDRLTSGELPEFVRATAYQADGARKAEPHLHDVRFPIRETITAPRLLEVLRTRKAQGAAYPCTLREAGREIRADVSEHELLTALESAAAAKRPLLALDGEADALVALPEDKELLVGDERLLRQLLDRLCSPNLPIVEVATLAGLLPKPLQAPFKKCWSDRLKSGLLPASVRARQLRSPGSKAGKPALQDLRFPLPWEDLSRQLVAAIHGWQDGLPTLKQLAAHAAPQATEELIREAIACAPYCDAVGAVYPQLADSPLYRREAAAETALRPEVLRRIVEAAVTPTDRAAPVKKLKVKNRLDAPLAAIFPESLAAALESGRLPAGVGAIRSGEWHLFLLEDAVLGSPRHASSNRPTGAASGTQDNRGGGSALQPAASSQTPQIATNETAFEPGFRAAFARLDKQSGDRNFIKLNDLRRELASWPRAEFDAGLADLRRRREFTLEASEGSMTALTEAEQAAGIMEAGTLLVYCRKLR